MSSRLPAWSRVAMAVLVPLWLLAVPSIASAQHGGGGHGGGGGGGHASSGGGGGHASGGGGHASGGGGHYGGGHVSGGSSAGSHTASRGAQPGPSSGTSSSGTTTGTAVQRGSDGSVAPGIPPYSKPRNGAATVGTATPRVGPPPFHGAGGGVYVPYYGGYYPWGLVGLGLYGGYYGGIYDPWYDPWGYGGGYYPPENYGYDYDQEGALHLKVKPKQAQVYVDGYYAGVVDDFDGVFQKLHVEPGPHRLEFRAEGYETLSVDVNVEPNQTITYKGEMKKIQ